jgi:hypothetical protein
LVRSIDATGQPRPVEKFHRPCSPNLFRPSGLKGRGPWEAAEEGDADIEDHDEVEEQTLSQMRDNASNQLDLATNILEDRELYYLAQSTKVLVKPCRDAYLDVLHQHSLGQLATAQWLAKRSSGGWKNVA